MSRLDEIDKLLDQCQPADAILVRKADAKPLSDKLLALTGCSCGICVGDGIAITDPYADLLLNGTNGCSEATLKVFGYKRTNV